ncbi:nucleoside phosphorylase [uncultured Rothia sp.]|uniref:nucleoside phosphorylase n=1 Tax=uncultured Rothia sp. TaxID=316088 RepID=UPI0025CBF466|nr:nucleoside phosphorylase [uncultured Rothia sp.]
MILEEFDPNRQAIINPQDLHKPIEGFPKVVISCFSRVTFARLLENYEHDEITRTSMANFEVIVYGITIGDQQIAAFNAPVGAASCVGTVEDLIQFGMKKLVLFGTCGVLDQDIKETSIIIPRSALRDEGTSYHYLPASDEVEVNQSSLPLFQDFLEKHQISHTIGKVWTTDAPYRETIGKMKRRKESGAICVDMECSAVAALAAFRGFELCHFFYAADHLSEEKWDIRTLSNHSDLDSKDRIADLAIQFALFWEKAD